MADDNAHENAPENAPVDSADQTVDQTADQKPKKNTANDFSHLTMSDDGNEIRKLVEFYFSDTNLPRDNYLMKQTGGNENRPVPLKLLHDFNRMKHFQPFSKIVEAIKQSEVLDVNDQDEVTRKTPLDDRFTDNIRENIKLLDAEEQPRAVYASGFPKKLASTAQTFIEDHFAPYNPLVVRCVRDHIKKFTGGAVVVFESEDAAKEVLQVEKPEFEHETENFPLVYEPKKQYDEGQDDDYHRRQDRKDRERKGTHWQSRNGKKRDDRNGNYKQRHNKRDSKRHRSDDEDDSDDAGRSKRQRDDDYRGSKDDWKARRNHDQNRSHNRRSNDNRRRDESESENEVDRVVGEYKEKSKKDGKKKPRGPDGEAVVRKTERSVEDIAKTEAALKKIQDAHKAHTAEKRARSDDEAADGEGESKKAKADDASVANAGAGDAPVADAPVADAPMADAEALS